ncbi:hypothetical protein E6O75_ATG04707 [Venturia nashicola]|uniref:Uncharacterized protein n=1 Tax=Venturia nashicola TaxID=86259 RepID=A0A4Z1NYW0_9PEZI|nr:hypothetical protein E6O75_ATG04707 [Venturia nashicola]
MEAPLSNPIFHVSDKAYSSLTPAIFHVFHVVLFFFVIRSHPASLLGPLYLESGWPMTMPTFADDISFTRRRMLERLPLTSGTLITPTKQAEEKLDLTFPGSSISCHVQ